jgi:hypothetical protein
MTVVRSSNLRAIAAAAMLGASALLSGCAKDPQSDGAPTDIEKQEQELLQGRIQKGIAESPIKSSR